MATPRNTHRSSRVFNRAVPRILDISSGEDASLDADAVLIGCQGYKVSVVFIAKTRDINGRFGVPQ